MADYGPLGQIWPIAYFPVAHEVRIVFIGEYLHQFDDSEHWCWPQLSKIIPSKRISIFSLKLYYKNCTQLLVYFKFLKNYVEICFLALSTYIISILSLGSQSLIYLLSGYLQKVLTPSLNCSNHGYTYALVSLFTIFYFHDLNLPYLFSYCFFLKRYHSSGKKFISDAKNRSSKIKSCHF